MVVHETCINLDDVQESCNTQVVINDSRPQQLDELDRRIVAALQVDPRATWGQIGAAVAASETTVLRRVQCLRENGVLVILGAPDPLRCGIGQPVLVQFRTSPGGAARIARVLAERADVRFVALLTGRSDVICEFIAPNHRYLSQVLLYELPDTGEILSTTTEVVLRTFKTGDQWSRKLLTFGGASAFVDERERFKRDGKTPKMDHLDMSLIAGFGSDGRRSYADLSQELGLSETTIARRVNALVADRRMYFVTLVDPRSLGFELEVLLHLRVDLSALESLANALAGRPEVRYISATTGYSDLACEAVFRDTDALYDFITQTLGPLKGIHEVEAAIELETIKRAFRYPFLATESQSPQPSHDTEWARAQPGPAADRASPRPQNAEDHPQQSRFHSR